MSRREACVPSSAPGARAVVALALAIATAPACKRQAEPRGLGPYRFGVTTLANVHQGVCQPTELTDGRKATWCFGLPPIKVGKRVAEVDAYFLGVEPPGNATAPPAEQKQARAALPLIELQLKIRGCVEDELDRWMRERYGPPKESKSTRQYWWNSFLWAGALMPSEPARCIVHFLPISETGEIERLKQK